MKNVGMKITDKIKSDYNTSEKIKTLIEREKDDVQKLLLIQYLLHFNCNHVTGRYSDEWIEEQIIHLAGRYIVYKPGKKKKCGSLIVMTTAAGIGGHTALVNNWIEFDKGHEYSIVFTEATPEIIPQFLRKTVQKSGGSLFYLRGGNVYSKAKELLYISEKYEYIFLHIHMYDVVPVMAYANRNWDIPVYFYNHADFRFSIGVSVSDCFLTICSYDNKRAVRYRGAENAYVLKIPQKIITLNHESELSKDEAKALMRRQYGFAENDRIILSMGDDYKYRPALGYDFIQFAKSLMAKLGEGYQFYIIGADRESARWKRVAEETGGKVKALGRLSRDTVTLLMKTADAYISSFPMMASGYEYANLYRIPAFSLGVTDRDYCYEKKNRVFASVKEMEDAVCDYFANIDTYEHVDIREGEYEYNEETWCARLYEILEHPLHHEVHRFSSKRIISKLERINAELIDETLYPFKEFDKLNLKNRIRLFLLK